MESKEPRSFSEKFIAGYKKMLPSPWAIAFLLTAITIVFATVFTKSNQDQGIFSALLLVLNFWESGLWQESQLTFAVQMMLMLVLGHVLAVSKPFTVFVLAIVNPINSFKQAVLVVAAFAMLSGFINWGLSLVFGAILARKMAVHCKKRGIAFNYGLLGACGYLGLLVWHMGFSGSSLIKSAELNHLKKLPGLESLGSSIPSYISLSETVLSSFNSIMFVVTFGLILLTALLISQKFPLNSNLSKWDSQTTAEPTDEVLGAEKLDYKLWVGAFFGVIVLGYLVVNYFLLPQLGGLGFITPNFINLSLLGFCLIFHGSIAQFVGALNQAIVGAAGILIQFPLYFGIMGVLDKSGLLSKLAELFIATASPALLPLLTMLSAALVNFFVPSGGGQWYIQGPIIVMAAIEIGIPLEKALLAFAYGDQLTNMLQPFWALPLLAITGLKAKEVLPYTFLFFAVSLVIFSVGFLLW
ncbi:MAG: TIGR00366 family protein [Luteibaculaceae bacterium]